MRLYFDKLVYLTFAATFFIFLIILIFKKTYEEELTVNFYMPETGIKGELIKFADSTAGAETWEWDFGDEKGKFIEQDGEYIFENART